MASDLLSRQRIAVAIEGELVVLSIGNADIKMPYETALQLSQWLRVRGKEAKRKAGDMSRHWSAIGLIEGAEVDVAIALVNGVTALQMLTTAILAGVVLGWR